MNITRDIEIEQWAEKEVCNNWGKEAREGIHLSDLLTPRKAYWQKVKPMNPTKEEILYWTSGNAIEERFLQAIGYQKAKVKEWEGILYTPDIFFNFPAEAKSRRRAMAKEGEESQVYDYYLKQLLGYCAIENKRQGWLLVFSMLERQDDGTTKPEWGFYRVEFTQEELEVERKRLIWTKKELEFCLDRDHLYGLPFCPTWMCGKESKTMTKKGYCLNCKKEFETESGIVKHPKSKTGLGHKITMPEYKREYIKRCKYYDDCKEAI